MGTIFTHRDKGISNDDWFRQEVFGDRQRIVASATISNVYYAAVRQLDTGEVWAAVILIHRSPRSYHNFGWKSLSEDMGPGDYNAPAKVLDELTETTHEWALEWRAACRAKLAAKAAQPKVTAGTKVDVGRVLKFVDNGEGQVFTFIERSRFRRADGKVVRIPNWKRDYRWSVAS
jgi:ketopantoate reductase